jgi:hypothetical protein
MGPFWFVGERSFNFMDSRYAQSNRMLAIFGHHIKLISMSENGQRGVNLWPKYS